MRNYYADGQRVWSWLETDLWHVKPEGAIRLGRLPLRWLRVLVLSIRKFTQDSGAIRASALTFYSVLAIVPLAALAFGMAKGFGVEQYLEEFLRERLAGQPAAAERIIEFSQNQLRQTRGGIVAGVGVVLLLFTAMRMLYSIEASFNAIWNTGPSRSFARKLGDYLAILLLTPILLIAASSLTVYLSQFIESLAEEFALWGISGLLAAIGVRLLPALLLWLLFTCLYLFMSNARVAPLSAVVGGVVAGTLYQVVQAVYIFFQVGAAEYGAIYGSFAALPLFLIWLQLSWTIVFYGAELAYAHEHVQEYEILPGAEKAGAAVQDYAALGTLLLAAKAVMKNTTPPTLDELITHLGLSRTVVLHAVERLQEVRILAQAQFELDAPVGYLPARDLDSLTLGSVLAELRGVGVNDIPECGPAFTRLRDALLEMNNAGAQTPADLPLKTFLAEEPETEGCAADKTE